MDRVYVLYCTKLMCSNLCVSIYYCVLSFMCMLTLISFTKAIPNASLFLKHFCNMLLMAFVYQ